MYSENIDYLNLVISNKTKKVKCCKIQALRVIYFQGVPWFSGKEKAKKASWLAKNIIRNALKFFSLLGVKLNKYNRFPMLHYFYFKLKFLFYFLLHYFYYPLLHYFTCVNTNNMRNMPHTWHQNYNARYFSFKHF